MDQISRSPSERTRRSTFRLASGEAGRRTSAVPTTRCVTQRGPRAHFLGVFVLGVFAVAAKLVCRSRGARLIVAIERGRDHVAIQFSLAFIAGSPTRQLVQAAAVFPAAQVRAPRRPRSPQQLSASARGPRYRRRSAHRRRSLRSLSWPTRSAGAGPSHATPSRVPAMPPGVLEDLRSGYRSAWAWQGRLARLLRAP